MLIYVLVMYWYVCIKIYFFLFLIGILNVCIVGNSFGLYIYLKFLLKIKEDMFLYICINI